MLLFFRLLTPALSALMKFTKMKMKLHCAVQIWNVQLKFIAVLDPIGIGNQETDTMTHAIAVELACKTFGHDRFDPTVSQRSDRGFAAAPASEIAARHDEITALHVGGEFRTVFDEADFGQLLWIGGLVVAPWGDEIGIDVVAK